VAPAHHTHPPPEHRAAGVRFGAARLPRAKIAAAGDGRGWQVGRGVPMYWGVTGVTIECREVRIMDKTTASAAAEPTSPAAPPVRTFVWNELMTTDMAAAKRFYGAAFGWGAQDMSMADPMQPAAPGEPGYTIWTAGADDRVGRGGGMQMEGPGYAGVPPQWLAYVAVEDADATAEKAKQGGGEIVAGPLDIKGVGRIYILRDPQGAVLGFGTFEPMGADCG
jgi:hypothetical protein